MPCLPVADASVAFISSVFEDAQTGPGTFARYVWQGLVDHPRFPTTVIAPTARSYRGVESVPRQGRFGSLRLYRRLRRKAVEVSGRLPSPVILHLNNAYLLGSLRRHDGPILVQLNDYIVADWARVARRKLALRDARGALSVTYRRYHEGRAVRVASAVVCNSRATAERIQAAYRLQPTKVHVVYKAVDLRHFARPAQLPPDPWSEASAGARLIAVGTDFQTKGLDVLLRALVQVRRELPEVRLAVVGPVHRRNVRFQALAQELGVADAVRFLGRLDHAELTRWLWWATLAVQPSREEALGVAALEAMSAGVPVVASDVGGLPEIVTAENGWLVPPEDAGSLGTVLVAALRDKEGLAARRAPAEAMAAQFGVERMLDALVDLYGSVVARG